MAKRKEKSADDHAEHSAKQAKKDFERADRIAKELPEAGKVGGAWAPPHVSPRKTPKGNPTTGWRSF